MITGKTQCMVPGCTTIRRREKGGLCTKHESRLKRNGDFDLKRLANVGSEFQQLRRHWAAMQRRCRIEPYLSKGIRVCARWKEEQGFWNFVEDMGQHAPGLTLDRIDNDGNYEPGNCRWATPQIQTHNSSKVKLTYADVRRIKHSAVQNNILAKQFGVSNQTISRIKRELTFVGIGD